VLCRDSIGRALLDAAVRAAAGRNCADLTDQPTLGRHPGMADVARRTLLTLAGQAAALPITLARHVDTDEIAAWMTDRYPADEYPAVVMGSPHGAALHLAAALGAPWLPTSFTVTIAWPGGAVDDWEGARRAGATAAEEILARNPGVTVRQVHDPVQRGLLAACTLTLHVRWRWPPPAYLTFLRRQLAPAGARVLLRDLRAWPAEQVTPGHSFQLGSPLSGWSPYHYDTVNPAYRRLVRALGGGIQDSPPVWTRRYSEMAGEPEFERSLRALNTRDDQSTYRVLYRNAAGLSACVADLYADWLRADGRGGRCVVETERLLDPWQAIVTGRVPYWCESAGQAAVTAAEWWLAGSRFPEVEVLPGPPGVRCGAYADLDQWWSIASFAQEKGRLDTGACEAYPLHPLPVGHATSAMPSPPDAAKPRTWPLRAEAALATLRQLGKLHGVLVL